MTHFCLYDKQLTSCFIVTLTADSRRRKEKNRKTRTQQGSSPQKQAEEERRGTTTINGQILCIICFPTGRFLFSHVQLVYLVPTHGFLKCTDIFSLTFTISFVQDPAWYCNSYFSGHFFLLKPSQQTLLLCCDILIFYFSSLVFLSIPHPFMKECSGHVSLIFIQRCAVSMTLWSSWKYLSGFST